MANNPTVFLVYFYFDFATLDQSGPRGAIWENRGAQRPPTTGSTLPVVSPTAHLPCFTRALLPCWSFFLPIHCWLTSKGHSELGVHPNINHTAHAVSRLEFSAIRLNNFNSKRVCQQRRLLTQGAAAPSSRTQMDCRHAVPFCTGVIRQPTRKSPFTVLQASRSLGLFRRREDSAASTASLAPHRGAGVASVVLTRLTVEARTLLLVRGLVEVSAEPGRLGVLAVGAVPIVSSLRRRCNCRLRLRICRCCRTSRCCRAPVVSASRAESHTPHFTTQSAASPMARRTVKKAGTPKPSAALSSPNPRDFPLTHYCCL